MSEVWRDLLHVQLADGEMVTWHLECSFEESWRLSLTDPGKDRYEATDWNLYDCLKQIRRRTDKAGILLCCNGARKNTRPSGFYASMGAEVVYREYRWRLGFATDLVGTFDYAPPHTIGTVEEQEAYLQKVDRYKSSALFLVNPLTWITLALRIPFNLVYDARTRHQFAKESGRVNRPTGN
jgi:hypothetical protein